MSYNASATQNVIDAAMMERRRAHELGWTAQHDDAHTNGELGRAAIAKILAALGDNSEAFDAWPFELRTSQDEEKQVLSPFTHSPRALMIEAIQFAVAEVERMDRAGVGR